MTQSEKMGLIGGTMGAVLGGTAWIIIAGIVVKSPLFILVPILWGALCIVGVVKLYTIHPERKFAILGAALLWLVVLNFIMGNVLYEKIPYTLGGISTGKEQFSLLALNVFLGFFSLWGFIFLIRDILEKKGA